jgi:hypothetical protein
MFTIKEEEEEEEEEVFFQCEIKNFFGLNTLTIKVKIISF